MDVVVTELYFLVGQEECHVYVLPNMGLGCQRFHIVKALAVAHHDHLGSFHASYGFCAQFFILEGADGLGKKDVGFLEPPCDSVYLVYFPKTFGTIDVGKTVALTDVHDVVGTSEQLIKRIIPLDSSHQLIGILPLIQKKIINAFVRNLSPRNVYFVMSSTLLAFCQIKFITDSFLGQDEVYQIHHAVAKGYTPLVTAS